MLPSCGSTVLILQSEHQCCRYGKLCDHDIESVSLVTHVHNTHLRTHVSIFHRWNYDADFVLNDQCHEHANIVAECSQPQNEFIQLVIFACTTCTHRPTGIPTGIPSRIRSPTVPTVA